MNDAKKSWIWFAAILLLIVGAGVYLGMSRRADLGQGFAYSVEEYRRVDPALIRYTEVAPIVPAVGKLSALAIAPDGKIYVGGESGIEIFPDKTIHPVGGAATCLAVDDDGTLFAGMQDHVEVFSSDWKKTAWPSPGEKTWLTSIAVDDRYVYAADAGGRRVLRYSKSGGKPLEIGTKDEANGVHGFNVPSPFFDLDIGTDGSLWVVNPGYHALENYSPDGRLISSWEKNSLNIEGFVGCCNPANFALLSDGAFVTAEKKIPRVKIYNLDGSLRCVVVAPNQFDADAEGLDVAADRQGRIYVLDPSRGKVRIFEEKK
ncbi:MAG: hypothetical protein HOO88_03085 [Kiritimatiellaceae bacterium]|nr:hypothetical protein [Kiritimatiellaceae bacterium]